MEPQRLILLLIRNPLEGIQKRDSKNGHRKKRNPCHKWKNIFLLTKNNLTQYYDTYGNPVTNEGLPIPTVIQFPSDFPDKIGC